jgi:hypothetical protein
VSDCDHCCGSATKHDADCSWMMAFNAGRLQGLNEAEELAVRESNGWSIAQPSGFQAGGYYAAKYIADAIAALKETGK